MWVDFDFEKTIAFMTRKNLQCTSACEIYSVVTTIETIYINKNMINTLKIII